MSDEGKPIIRIEFAVTARDSVLPPRKDSEASLVPGLVEEVLVAGRDREEARVALSRAEAERDAALARAGELQKQLDDLQTATGDHAKLQTEAAVAGHDARSQRSRADALDKQLSDAQEDLARADALDITYGVARKNMTVFTAGGSLGYPAAMFLLGQEHVGAAVCAALFGFHLQVKGVTLLPRKLK